MEVGLARTREIIVPYNGEVHGRVKLLREGETVVPLANSPRTPMEIAVKNVGVSRSRGQSRTIS